MVIQSYLVCKVLQRLASAWLKSIVRGGERPPLETALEAGAGLFLCGLLLLDLGVHGAQSLVGTRSALFAPAFENLAVLFEIGERQGILEHGAKRRDNGFEAFPDDPLFARVFEEEILIDQAAIDDARAHLPVAEHH